MATLCSEAPHLLPSSWASQMSPRAFPRLVLCSSGCWATSSPLPFLSLPKTLCTLSLPRRRVTTSEPHSTIRLMLTVTATYLEPLKDGKTPVEILVRGKDAAENAKQFETCLDIIKNAGVCFTPHSRATLVNMFYRRKSALSPRTPRTDPSSRSGRIVSQPFPRTSKRWTSHQPSQPLSASRTRRSCAQSAMPRAHPVASWPTTLSTKCQVFWMRRKR